MRLVVYVDFNNRDTGDLLKLSLKAINTPRFLKCIVFEMVIHSCLHLNNYT